MFWSATVFYFDRCEFWFLCGHGTEILLAWVCNFIRQLHSFACQISKFTEVPYVDSRLRIYRVWDDVFQLTIPSSFTLWHFLLSPAFLCNVLPSLLWFHFLGRTIISLLFPQLLLVPTVAVITTCIFLELISEVLNKIIHEFVFLLGCVSAPVYSRLTFNDFPDQVVKQCPVCSNKGIWLSRDIGLVPCDFCDDIHFIFGCSRFDHVDL